MAIDREFQTYVEDLFSPVDGVSVRRMFGGLGIFRNGLMFGLVEDQGRICLKADAATEPDFQAEGCELWVYHGKGKPMSMGYWYMPERLMDDPDELKAWAMSAYEVAVRADQKKPPSQRKLKEPL